LRGGRSVKSLETFPRPSPIAARPFGVYEEGGGLFSVYGWRPHLVDEVDGPCRVFRGEMREPPAEEVEPHPLLWKGG